MAFGDTLLERYVLESVRAALFLSHSREAPSLAGRLNDTALAPVHPVFQIKVWDIPYVFICGCDGNGIHPNSPDTLLKVI